MNCPYCNNPLLPGAERCSICGKLLPTANAADMPTCISQNTASLVLGIGGLVLGVIPVIGFPLSTAGLIFGIRGNYKLGIILNTIGWGIAEMILLISFVMTLSKSL